MTLFKKRPMPVKAIQWTGDNPEDLPEGSVPNLGGGSKQISDGRSSKVVPPRHAGVRLANRAVVVMEPGDYLVVTDLGGMQVRRQGEFEAEYEAVHAGDGEIGQTDGPAGGEGQMSLAHVLSRLQAGGFSQDEEAPEDPELRRYAIQFAAAQLDPENTEHWTKNKAPQVGALEALLGFDITAGERDEAWAAVQASQE